VLDRVQTGANAEFVRTEFERASREVEAAFADKARAVGEQLSSQLDDVFGPDSGHLSKALERHFSDGSSTAVQHRVKAVVDEVMARSRDDMRRLFSADDGQNPLAAFQRTALSMLKQAADQQDAHLRALHEKMAAHERELQRITAEREKQLELEEERERGTAKGRTFEEAVYEALDAIALAQGDDCDSVGDLRAATGKSGDVVVAIDACRGPARGRIVFEAKNSRLSKKAALEELDEALQQRDADYAVMVVPREDKLPAKTVPLREHSGDKLFVTFDPEDGSRLSLEVAYALARARVLMARAEGEGIDGGALRAEVERALGAMEEVRRVKLQLTGASNSIEEARKIVDAMAARVRAHLEEIDALLAPADGG
jgi:hypothetical protein